MEVFGGAVLGWAGVGQSAREADGTISLMIYARELRDAGYLAASGGLAFYLLLQAEREKGVVPAILGLWYPSSDNFKAYSLYRSQGDTPEVAACKTFTGRLACAHGYARVVDVRDNGGVPPDWVKARFEPGD